jgi:hypothetical protein
MRLLDVQAPEYQRSIVSPLHVFNTVAFSEHNRSKCEEIHYLVWENAKGPCLGLLVGRRGSRLFSPFSAPCGGFSPVGTISAEEIREAVLLLCGWARERNLSVSLYPPPHFYAPQFLEQSLQAMIACGFKVECEELNHQIPLTSIKDYEDSLWRNALKNLRKAEQSDLVFSLLDPSELGVAYEVIRQNRVTREKPLRMSFEEVKSTMTVIEGQSFVVRRNGSDVAAAIVFHVAPQIAQVIYWGDCPGYSEYRPMNFLVAELVKFYLSQNFRLLDIGISTVDGVRDDGLCNFKESVGCVPVPRYRLVFA